MRLVELERDIVRLARELAQQTARWLLLVAEFDRRGGAKRAGFPNTGAWLAWRCGISKRAAREHARVARALAEREHLRSAFVDGRLSYSKTRALARVPDRDDHAEWVDIAEKTTAHQLEHIVRGLRNAPSADLDAAVAGHARRYVEYHWDEDGSLRFHGRLGPDAGAAFVEALEKGASAMRTSLLPAEAGEEPPPRAPLGALRADALVEMMSSGPPRTQVVLHVDEAALACNATGAAERAGATCHLAEGPAIPSETARRLACDCEVTPLVAGVDGTPRYGRSRRTVSPQQRKALERLQPRCPFPGCDRRHGRDGHLIIPWALGGGTDPENLTLLCPQHHWLVHEGGWRVKRADDVLHFVRPDGLVMPSVPSADWRAPPLAMAA